MQRKGIRVLAGIVIVLVIAYIGLSVLARPVADHPFFADDQFLVLAHQGGERLRPSNTISAFSNAVDLGVDVLEMDIHSTVDGALVVIHDDTVDRTTDGSGRVHDLTLAEIKTLDAGFYWTDDDGESFPYRGHGIAIPTLEEVLTAFPDMRMNIEIKQETPSIVEPLCQMLRDHGKVDSVLIASFHKAAIEEFREQCPGVATSMVESEIRLLFVLNAVYLARVFQAPAEAIQIPEYSGDLHVATERLVKAAHSHNLEVHVWTVNDIEDMQRLLDIGVDGIITDRPDRLLELVGQH